MSNLRCPWAENHINVSTSGHISTCCLSVPVIDSSTNEIYNIRTHTLTQAFNSKEFESIRLNLRNGIRDQQCQQCWQVEDLGGRSIRQGGIDQLEDRNIHTANSTLIHLNLDLSNQCNLKCRTCGPTDSSAWVEEYKTIYLADTGNSAYKLFKHNIVSEQEFFKDIKENIIPNLMYLHFKGGEPFLIKQQWQIIDDIIELDYAKNLTVLYHTNGTIWNNDIENKLSKFGNVELALSIDDIEQRFEYIRHPAVWNTVRANIMAIKKWAAEFPENRQYGINCTVSIYNVFTIRDILEFCDQEAITIFLHPTMSPDHFSVVNLPQSAKLELLDVLNFSVNAQIDIELENLRSMVLDSKTDMSQWKHFVYTTELHDDYRTESWKMTFPRLLKAIQSYV